METKKTTRKVTKTIEVDEVMYITTLTRDEAVLMRLILGGALTDDMRNMATASAAYAPGRHARLLTREALESFRTEAINAFTDAMRDDKEANQ